MNNFSAEEQRRLADINNSIPQLLAGNILHDADGNPPVLLAGAEYNGIWLEHNQDCFFAADLFPDIAWNSQNIFMRHQQPDGLLPYAFRFNPFRVCVSQLQTVWPFARCALETARKFNRPEADFARIYEAGIRYDSWLKQYRSRNALGLVDMYCAFDTGHDNSRRVMDGGIPNPCPDKWAGNMPELPCMPIAAADLSAMRFGGLEALAELAEMLDKPQEAKELRVEAEMLKSAIHTHLFDRDDEFFYDLSQGVFRKYRTEHITRIFLNHVVDQALFDRIYNRYFENENEFAVPYPFPSVSVSDPSYNADHPHNCWGGNTQLLTLLRLPLWMEHYRRPDELTRIMKRYLKAFLRHDNPFTQELHPETGAPIGNNGNYTPALLFFREAYRRVFSLEKEALV